MNGSGPSGVSSETLMSTTQRLFSRYPGRELQIQQLVSLVGTYVDATPSLLVYGPASTGKTSLVRLVFQELRKSCVYVSCTEFRKPRQLFGYVLDQLKGRKRTRQDSYVMHSKSEMVADFLAELPGAAGNASAMYIVVDEAHRATDQGMLAVLLRLRELTGVRLGVILISRVAWGSNVFSHESLYCQRPIEISFPAYEPAELASILAVDPVIEAQQCGLETFANFMRAEILSMFARSTLNLNDIKELVSLLFPLYLKPVVDGTVAQGDSRRLHSLFQPLLLAAKAAFDSGTGWKGALAELASSAADTKQRAPQAVKLDFELPYHSKVLLLAAYICSRNKATLDRTVFDLSAKTGRQKGGHKAQDRRMELAREAALKGPHSFPIERLLSAFWHLLRSGGEGDDEDPTEGFSSRDTFMQVTSLVSLKLLSRVSTDPLEEVRYRCHVEDELAAAVARNLSITLQDYLLYV